MSACDVRLSPARSLIFLRFRLFLLRFIGPGLRRMPPAISFDRSYTLWLDLLRPRVGWFHIPRLRWLALLGWIDDLGLGFLSLILRWTRNPRYRRLALTVSAGGNHGLLPISGVSLCCGFHVIQFYHFGRGRVLSVAIRLLHLRPVYLQLATAQMMPRLIGVPDSNRFDRGVRNPLNFISLGARNIGDVALIIFSRIHYHC